MVESSVRKIEVEFTRNAAEKTGLSVTQRGEGLYNVNASYLFAQGSGFPSHEMTERSGGAFADSIEELRQKIIVSCRSWYHHYCRESVGVPDRYYQSSWSICIDNDGSLERWEGLGCAPSGLDNVYDELVAFGMPSLRLGYSGSFEAVCGRSEGVSLDPWHVISYRRTLQHLVDKLDAGKDSDGGAAESDTVQLMDEFVEDTDLFLRLSFPEAFDEAAFANTWQIEETIEALCDVDVHGANRREMMLLLGSFVRLEPSHDDVAKLVGSGAFDRWCRRLRMIPEEEHEERVREERERRLAIANEIDTAIRGFVASKTPFTSHDVARACGVTPQQASGRIRTFVQRGEVTPLEGSLPRRYRVA